MLTKFFIFAFLFIGAQADAVQEWTDENFESNINDPQFKDTLVMFYAPWCGHCKSLKPEYAKASDILQGSGITLAKVDCTEAGKATCNKFSVSGYPTLKIFSEGQISNDYSGPRDANGIVKYMKAQVGPASTELKDKESLAKFLADDDVVIVSYATSSDSPLAVAFQSVAKKLREKAKFGHVIDKEIINKDFEDKIVLHRPKLLQNKFEDSNLVYSGEAEISDIVQFVEKNYHGIVGVRTRDNAADFKKPSIFAYYSVDYTKNPKGTNYWRNRVLKVAKNYPEFNYAICSIDDFQHELNEYGLDYTKGDKPVVLARDDKNQKFAMKEDFSIDAFEKFITELRDEKLEPYIKSEEIPADNSGPVKVAVAKNFEELVIKNDKDILVEFYAPWCGHCKKLAPVLEELGEKLADEDVEIVKFDATANDVPPQFNVRGFPTIFWLAKDSKSSPVSYEGGRDVADFLKYIAEHASSPLKNFDKKGEAVSKDKKEEL